VLAVKSDTTNLQYVVDIGTFKSIYITHALWGNVNNLLDNVGYSPLLPLETVMCNIKEPIFIETLTCFRHFRFITMREGTIATLIKYMAEMCRLRFLPQIYLCMCKQIIKTETLWSSYYVQLTLFTKPKAMFRCF